MGHRDRRQSISGTKTPAGDRWFGLLAAAAPFLLYLRTMAPTVYGVDSAELTTGAYLLGIVHPPGSPSYLLLGHLFSHLPVGDVGYRLNLMSGCGAALALFFLYRALRHLECTPAIALASCLCLGSSYYMWISAVAAELYAIEACVMAALLVLGLRWNDRGRASDLWALALCFGLGLGVHPSLALLAPGFALLILSRAELRQRERVSLGALACFLLGALVYAYLPIRYASDLPLNPARDSWQIDLASWEGFWWTVTARPFSHLFLSVPAAQLPVELFAYGQQVGRNFTGLGMLLGGAGLITDFGRRPVVHAALICMLLSYLAFYLPYGAADKHVMLLPTYLIWATWIGLGAQNVAVRLAEKRDSAQILGATLLFGIAALGTVVNFRLVDVSSDWSARERGLAILRHLEPDAVYFGGFADLRIVEYLQFVEGRRTDVRAIDLTFTADAAKRHARIVERLGGGRPVYVQSCREWRDSSWRCEELQGCECARLARAM